MARKVKKKQPKKYRGYFTFPLMGAKSQWEFESMLKTYGDFANPDLERRIYNRPRQYKIEVHIKKKGTNEWHIVDAVPHALLTKPELSQVIAHLGKEAIKLSPRARGLYCRYY